MYIKVDKHPICPHCNKENDTDDTDNWEIYDKDEQANRVNCWHCDERFWVQPIVSYRFQTCKTQEELELL